MMSLLLVVLPLIAALVAYGAKGKPKIIRFLLLFAALVHSGMTVAALLLPDDTALSLVCWGSELLGIDGLSMIFLMMTSLLFLLVSIHILFWLPAEEAVDRSRAKEHYKNVGLLREHIFIPCLLAFLSMMTLVICSRNLGLLWVALEATTLVSAPLICFHRSAHSLEAMWKYLLICSVGIGLALFGTMLVAVAGMHAGGLPFGLNFNLIRENTGLLDPGWFKAAFIFALIGYGTKMGLAPLHTWLPDAYSEAPGTVSALLSGALMNCSFLALIRYVQIAPDSLKEFCNGLLITFGIFSLAVAAFFIIRQSDFKRMIAYSSIEHVGLAVILWGIGAESITVLHICGHSIIKMVLFLLAGNILMAYGTRSVSAIGGMFGILPRNAVLWVIGILLICGTPPSPLFVTEYLLVRDAPLWLGITVLVLLFAIFAGMAIGCLKMTMGKCEILKTGSFSAKEAEKLWGIPFVGVVTALVSGGLLLLILNMGRL